MIQDFLDFSDRLTASLSEREDVLGLIFLGSAAQTDRVDEWSDHDFFVIVKDGNAEKLRQDLSWLPDHKLIVISPRETQHGLKVVYEDGHVLEFAIFDDHELDTVTANVFVVTIDRADIFKRIDAAAQRSVPKPVDEKTEFELFLSQLLIGVGRARRGETLTAGQFIRAYCVNHVLGLLRIWAAPIAGTETGQDSFNRFRRFEWQHPELAARLEELQQLPVEASAKGLLHLVLEIGADSLSDEQLHQVYVVRHRLGWRA